MLATYSHGYLLPDAPDPEILPVGVEPDPLPADIQLVVMQLAGRRRNAASDDGQVLEPESRTIGSFSHTKTYATGGGASTDQLTPFEFGVLDQYTVEH